MLKSKIFERKLYYSVGFNKDKKIIVNYVILFIQQNGLNGRKIIIIYKRIINQHYLNFKSFNSIDDIYLPKYF